MATRRRKNGRGNTPIVATELHTVTCLWCGCDDLVANPRQQYCNDKNHRIYRSKKRSATLYTWWITFMEVFHPNVSRMQAAALYKPAMAERIAARFGFFYSDQSRRWELDFSIYA